MLCVKNSHMVQHSNLEKIGIKDRLQDSEKEMITRDMSRNNFPGAEQQIELLKAELLTTVSHELRGPLTSIKGYAATLLRYSQRLSQEEQIEFLMAISGASARLEHIINQLLEMSQLETDTLPITMVPVNLTYLVQEAITAAQLDGGSELMDCGLSSPPRMVTYAFSIQQEEALDENNVVVQGDRSLLRNMLDALIENAAHYSPNEGQVTIGIHLHRDKQTLADLIPHHLQRSAYPLPLVEIQVKDRGIGIPTEHLPYIFDRFYRVDTGLTREVNGLGLGLSICKRIVELHDGMIWGESSLGQGSTFHILLPEAPHNNAIPSF
jgi:signal transduction histidine kinase